LFLVRLRRLPAGEDLKGTAERLVALEPRDRRRRVLALAPPQVGKDAARLLRGEVVPGPGLHLGKAEPVEERLREAPQALVGDDARRAEALVRREPQRAKTVQRH